MTFNHLIVAVKRAFPMTVFAVCYVSLLAIFILS